MQAKSILVSKTFWFSVIFLVTQGAVLLGYNQFTPDADTQRLAEMLVVVGPWIINIILRLITKQPAALKLPDAGGEDDDAH